MGNDAERQDPFHSPIFMSVPRWAFARCTGDATGRWVLAALCAYRRKGDGLCYPSLDTLTDLTGLSRRTVNAALARLVASEAIRLARPWTQHMPNTYAIPDREPALQRCSFNASGATAEMAPEVQNLHARGAAAAPELSAELTTGTTTTAATAPSARAVAVHDCIAISSSAADRGIYTQRRSSRQRGKPVAFGVIAGEIMDGLIARRTA